MVKPPLAVLANSLNISTARLRTINDDSTVVFGTPCVIVTAYVKQELTLYGVQRRNVTCRHVCAADSTLSSMNPGDACQLSSDDDPPATERLCRLPCPQDCVVTELGLWSTCCGGLQTRRRRVLVGPQHGGQACRAPMFESRRCDVDDDDEACGLLAAQTTRRRHVYLVGRWSECEDVVDRHPIGRRYRSVSCVDELGRPTELRYNRRVPVAVVTLPFDA